MTKTMKESFNPHNPTKHTSQPNISSQNDGPNDGSSHQKNIVRMTLSPAKSIANKVPANQWSAGSLKKENTATDSPPPGQLPEATQV